MWLRAMAGVNRMLGLRLEGLVLSYAPDVVADYCILVCGNCRGRLACLDGDMTSHNEFPLARDRVPDATARFLLVLAEAIDLGNADLTASETTGGPIAVRVEEFLKRRRDGTSFVASDDGVLGAWAGLLDFAAEYGVAPRVARVMGWSLSLRASDETRLLIVLATLLEADVPIVDAVPALAEALELPWSLAKAARQAFERGEDLSHAMARWPAYAPPLRDLLAAAEATGGIAALHRELGVYLLEGLIVLPLPREDEEAMLGSFLALMAVALRAGLTLSLAVTALADGFDDASWWGSFAERFEASGSLAEGLAATARLSALAEAILAEAEHAGRMDDALTELCRMIKGGTLRATAPQRVDEDNIGAFVELLGIRGRMAYALLCLESAHQAWAAGADRVEELIDLYWTFTDSDALDEWQREVQEVIPIDFPGLDLDEIETDGISGEERWRGVAQHWGFDHLVELRQEALVRMLACAYQIGANNLYSGFQSDLTADPLCEIIDVMRLFELELPDTARAAGCRVEQRWGWGPPMTRSDFGSGVP